MIKAACGVGIKEEEFTHRFPFPPKVCPMECYCLLHFQDCMCEYQIGCDPHLSIRREAMGLETTEVQYIEKGAPWRGAPAWSLSEHTSVPVPTGALNQTRWGLMQVFDMIAIDFDPVLCFLIKTGIKTVDCSCFWLFLTHGSMVMSLKGLGWMSSV